MYNFSLELLTATEILVKYIVKVRKNQKAVITGDYSTDWKLVEATAQAILMQGAQCEIIKHPTLAHPCKELPSAFEPVIFSSDIWFEFSPIYSLYSSTYNKAIYNGCHYVCLPGMNTDMAIRMIGSADHETLSRMAIKLNQISQNSNKFRLTSFQGSDFSVEIDPQMNQFDIPCEDNDGGFGQMLGGQIGFSIYPNTLNGCMVFDGTIWPPAEISIPKEPVELTINSGVIIEITGGRAANMLNNWLGKFNNQSMFKIDHICYGFHPQVRQLTGNILEDERLWGCIQIGIGRVSEGAPSHCDAIITKPSIWLDNIQIEEEGKYLDPEIVELSKKFLSFKAT